MSTPSSQKPARTYSLLLRFVSGFLFFGAGSSVVILFSPTTAALGTTYQACLAVASVVSATAAYGLWKHMKWGAWTYLALTAINQPFLYLMGWWVAGALIIPGILILLIFAKFKWLK
jgi:hypothetical protein